jgi:DNA-binding transcriptional ArsR family regulator
LVIIENKKMKDIEKARWDARAAVMKAMAHPTRLMIVEKLSEKPYCVQELTEMVGADISTVSKHLSILKNAGMITDTKYGKQVYYRLRMLCVLGFLGCVEAVLQEQAQASMDLLQKP